MKGCFVASSRVYLEKGKNLAFAVSLDWPGWCRHAKTPDGALEALERYRERYAEIVTSTFSPGHRQGKLHDRFWRARRQRAVGRADPRAT